MGYIAFTKSFAGKKIVRVHDVNSDVTVGVTGSGYDEWYRYPASFLIPEDDPQFSKEGNTANDLVIRSAVCSEVVTARCEVTDKRRSRRFALRKMVIGERKSHAFN